MFQQDSTSEEIPLTGKNHIWASHPAIDCKYLTLVYKKTIFIVNLCCIRTIFRVL